MLGIFDGIINQYFYVKTELYPAVQCVKAKILLLLVGMFFVKHERWLPIFYDSKLRGSHKEVLLTHKKCHTLHKKMVALINCHFFLSLNFFFLNFSSSCEVKVSMLGVVAILYDYMAFPSAEQLRLVHVVRWFLSMDGITKVHTIFLEDSFSIFGPLRHP